MRSSLRHVVSCRIATTARVDANSALHGVQLGATGTILPTIESTSCDRRAARYHEGGVERALSDGEGGRGTVGRERGRL